ARSLGDHRVPARVTAQPKRNDSRCSCGPARRTGEAGVTAAGYSNMSERSHTVPTPEGEYFESNRFAGLSSLLGLIAIVALALCVVGAFLNPRSEERRVG